MNDIAIPEWTIERPDGTHVQGPRGVEEKTEEQAREMIENKIRPGETWTMWNCGTGEIRTISCDLTTVTIQSNSALPLTSSPLPKRYLVCVDRAGDGSWEPVRSVASETGMSIHADPHAAMRQVDLFNARRFAILRIDSGDVFDPTTYHGLRGLSDVTPPQALEQSRFDMDSLRTEAPESIEATGKVAA